jgi:exopolyphosphatase/guanosine-5'-triphosphate,3'-diphosphate pyrophosphatase
MLYETGGTPVLVYSVVQLRQLPEKRDPSADYGSRTVRRACIDIGSNTTRLLVAECQGEHLHEIEQERAFTRIGRGIASDGTIDEVKIAEVVEVVTAQLEHARDLGSSEVIGVATAAIRRAANGRELVRAIETACGLRVRILSGEEEARLAFIGAAGTLGHRPAGALGVVDVGGGSSEIVVGTAPHSIGWWFSVAIGSGDLADKYLRSDPPLAAELASARAGVAAVLEGVKAPLPLEAVAVGGSATSMRRLAGSVLDRTAFERTFSTLAAASAAEVARRFALDHQRVRLLPAGLLILEAVSELFGTALQVGCGGIREGVLLEASG